MVSGAPRGGGGGGGGRGGWGKGQLHQGGSGIETGHVAIREGREKAFLETPEQRVQFAWPQLIKGVSAHKGVAV